MKKQRFLMSVSGGRSSVMLAKLLVDTEKLKPVDVIIGGFYVHTKYVNDTSEFAFAFSNTSREKEACLEFMRDVEKFWGIKVTWVEALIDLRKNKGTRHKVVNFETAKRNGEIFEDVIRKYGIPNVKFPHCTREMKQAAIRSFMKYIGWGTWKDYKTILGFRADEPKRTNPENLVKLNQWWPLWEWGIKKPDVAFFWNRQPFDLKIEVDADGNCENCWKKADLKLLYQAKSNPKGIEWIREMEIKYGNYSAGRSGGNIQYNFFRDDRTIDEILEQYPEIMAMSIEEIKELLNDKSLLEDGAMHDLLYQLGCEESCEAFTEVES
jgi:3'-phosphoadenosine 5'-phosphosulfate sulfotransferase (PAPS reductase)/FAD synthetase